MTKLLLIADDFTGALDAGIQFAARGAEAKVLTAPPETLDTSAEVLAVNAASRHLPPEEAAGIVGRLAAMARQAGIPYLYKKTDSALRGNVGAELGAALSAWGSRSLTFAPAYPALRRTTGAGVQYVDGVPVSESPFGADPLDPVRESFVPDLLRSGTDAPVALRGPGEAEEERGICVYDAETDGDLARIASEAAAAGQTLFAGCAGFAGALAPLLGLTERPRELPPLPGPVLAVCGSLHPVTAGQIRFAEERGFRRIEMTREGSVPAAPVTGHTVLTPPAPEGEPSAEAGVMTARALAKAAVSLLEVSPPLTLFCTGGDTLLAVAEALGVTALEPLAELSPGVVLSVFERNGTRRPVISKAGGFGNAPLLAEIAERTERI